MLEGVLLLKSDKISAVYKRITILTNLVMSWKFEVALEHLLVKVKSTESPLPASFSEISYFWLSPKGAILCHRALSSFSVPTTFRHFFHLQYHGGP